MKIVKWISWDEAQSYPEVTNEEYQLYEAILIDTLTNKDYIICGNTHQHCCVPVFSDGKVFTCSFRVWGAIMAAARNIRENTDKYDYMDFYMAYYCDNERLPEGVTTGYEQNKKEGEQDYE